MPTVVVIEEDMGMRALIGEWLTDAGYRVDPRLEAAAPQPGVALVIVDVANPRAAEARLQGVREAYPAAALIGLSAQLGRSLPVGASSARMLGLHQLLAKPCTRHELMAAVADATGGAPVPSGGGRH